MQEDRLEISLDGMSPELTMPIVTNDKYAVHFASFLTPNPQFGEEYLKWLQVSVRIHVEGASGSGTIIHYDGNEWAYIQSCGHLWGNMQNNMTSEEGLKRKITCKIVAFYQNGKKLLQPKTYSAEVLYYNNLGGPGGGSDCSLLRFKPDWAPNYIPIAPDNYEIRPGTRFHSTGCDGGSEAANYDVKLIETDGAHFVTTENSPRPGRSGGGLMDDNYYIAICWGTSDKSGNGVGYFTPLKTIRKLNDKNGYGWLNEISSSLARKIPIRDRNNPQGNYGKDYIPLPGGKI